MDRLSMGQIVSLATPAPSDARRAADPAKVAAAAQQFESLLIGQILRSVRESGSGWLGSGGDGSGDCATEFAEQHLAEVLASGGGLGLSKLIADGLKNRP